MAKFQVGDRVKIEMPEGHVLYTTSWWPKLGTPVTGTVEKVFKNGKVAIAVDQLRNGSDDRKKTLHFSPADYITLV